MQETLTIPHTCPICNQTGLQVLTAPNLRRSPHDVVCTNEHYLHVAIGEINYLVRSSHNIIEEMELCASDYST
jgi:hypothetical protein